MEEKIRVLLVADNRLLRESLQRILQKRTDIGVVGAEPFSENTLGDVARASPEVLLFDSLGHEPAKFEFIECARRELPEMKIVLIGMDEDEEMFLKAVRVGAVGYVLQEAGAIEVVNAVRAVTHKEAVCPPQLCRVLFEFVAQEVPARKTGGKRRRQSLSRREQELLPLLAQGLTNKEIAVRLNLSEQTVKNHVHRMLHKVGAPDRVAIVELCRNESPRLRREPAAAFVGTH